MKIERIFFLLLLAAMGLFCYFSLPKTPVSQNNHLLDLFARLREFELRYADYLMATKKLVQDTYQSDAVQKLSRPQLRKEFSFANQEELNNVALRFHFYAVTKKDNDLDVRAVYDDFKPKMLWEKVLDLLVTQAFEITGEKSPKKDGDDKTSALIAMVMKGSGLAEIKEPGCFIDLNLMGESQLLYWDVLYRKCPASVEQVLDRQKCVRGIFVAEIDQKNLIRDFFLSSAAKNQTSNFTLAFLAQEENLSYVEALYPENKAGDELLGQAFLELFRYRTPVFYGLPEQPQLLIESWNMTDVCIGVSLNPIGQGNIEG